MSDDFVTVKLSYNAAIGYLEGYRSKYLGPAVDAVKSVTFPLVLNNPEEFDRFDKERTIVSINGNIYVRETCNWYRPGFVGAIQPKQLKDSSGQKMILYAENPVPEYITFDIPVEEARRIGGCKLTPLVQEWDNLHKRFHVGDTVTSGQVKNLPIGTELSSGGGILIVVPDGLYKPSNGEVYKSFLLDKRIISLPNYYL